MRDAMLRVFRNKTIKIVSLFRLLPLSVNDVLKIHTPVYFTDAFKIAELKSGGFDNCLAIMRDRGWNHHRIEEARRAETRGEIEATLRTHGVVVLKHDQTYASALSKGVERVVVWRLDTRSDFRMLEYDILLQKLYQAMGRWYRGIHKDVRSIAKALRVVRDTPEYVHVLLSNNTLVVGVISF